MRTYQSKTLFGSLELKLFFKVLFGQYWRPKCSSGKCLFQNHRNYTSMNIFKKTLGRLWMLNTNILVKTWSKLKFWYFWIDWMNTWIFDIFNFELPRKLISVSRKIFVLIFTKSPGLGTSLLVRDFYFLDSLFFYHRPGFLSSWFRDLNLKDSGFYSRDSVFFTKFVSFGFSVPGIGIFS